MEDTQETIAAEAPRVLVVDDDPSVRALFATVLEDAGMEVLTAADGSDALALLAATPVAAVLLDDRMPDLNGLDALRRLRASPETATLPVLLITGAGEVTERIAGLRAGADDYLVKPVDPDELVARVEAQLRGDAAWHRVVAEQLRERAAVGEALGRLRPSVVAEDTAEALCSELAHLDAVAGAAIVAFSAGTAVPLAAVGPGFARIRPGQPLPASVTAQLRAQTDRGAWVEHQAQRSEPSATPPLVTGASTVYAPVWFGATAVGLLILAGGQDADRIDRNGALLANAIDAARAAGALLGPALETRSALAPLRHRLARIVQDGAFHPVYQPIRDLRTGQPVGYEALTRFDDGTPPDVAFAEAADLGMGSELETASVAAALHDARMLPADTWLSVNVSPAFIVANDELPKLVRHFDRPLVLELTEHDRIDDYPGVLSAFDRLGPGVRLSVDDTGAGYASLNHVLALRPAFVKLDRAWTSGIDADPARQALVAGLVHFAAQTDAALIAEGIEVDPQLASLIQLGVGLGQGWLLGRPARLDD